MVGSLCLRPYALEPIGDAWHRGLVRTTVGGDALDAVIEAIDDLGAMGIRYTQTYLRGSREFMATLKQRRTSLPGTPRSVILGV